MSVSSAGCAFLLSVFMYSSTGTTVLPVETNTYNPTHYAENAVYYNSGCLQKNKMLTASVGKGELTMDILLTRNLNKLTMISKLTLNEDSISFTEKFTKDIGNLLYVLKFQPEIFPNYRGNIQLEYEEKNGKYLEIEITPDMKMKIFKIDADGNEYENEDYFDIDIAVINNEVNSFYG